MIADPSEHTIQDRILAAIGATRGGALNFPAYFVGIEWQLEDGPETCLAWARPHSQNLDPTGRLASMPLALLVDMAGAGAVRQRMGKEVSLPTVSLQLDLVDYPLPVGTAIGCRSRFVMEAGKIAVAQSALLSAEGDMIGTAQCRYLVHRSSSRPVYARYPWEEAPGDPATLEDLDDQEARVHDLLMSRLGSAASTAGTTGLHHRLFGITSHGTAAPSADGSALQGAATQLLGPHVANRRGFVQGGVAAGLGIDACVAATRQQPSGGDLRVRAFACTYLRPGHIDAGALEAASTVTFQGRRVAHLDVRVAPRHGKEVARGVAIFEQAST